MSQASDRFGARLAPFVLGLAVALAFGRSVGFGFVVWDDPNNVAGNPLLDPAALQSLGQFWTRPFEHLYVPVAYTIWWGIAFVSRLFFGRLEPALFHTANLVLHALSVLLVYRWLCQLIEDRRAACAGALVFALHPLQVESVCWISELRGLASAALGFGALVLAQRRPRWIAAAVFALALLAKPTAVAFAVVLFAQELIWRKRPWREMLRTHWVWIALAAGAGLVSLWAQAEVPTRALTPLAARPALALDALGFYLTKLAWPANLCAEYGRSPQVVLQSQSLWPACLALGLALAAGFALLGRRGALCTLVLFAGALLPVLGFVPFGFQEKSNVADRYAYVALGAAALGTALLVARHGRPAHLLALGLALVGGVLSFEQSGRWRDTQALFRRVLEINPRSITAHDNLGYEAIQRRDLESARQHFLRSVELDPERKRALSNLGAVECELGRYEEGIAHLREAVARNPRSILERRNLVVGLQGAGRLAEAGAAARELVARPAR